MKIIKVNNEKCIGCGLCVEQCKYLEENEEGNAKFVEGTAINENDIADVTAIITDCPQKALEIVEISTTNKKGQAGMEDVVRKANRKIKNFTVQKIKKEDIKFDERKYFSYLSFSNNPEFKSFKSRSAAESYARSKFNKICYSSTAYKPVLKKVFAEYTADKLRPYHILEENDSCVYFKYIKQAQKILSDVRMEINSLANEDNLIPESWTQIKIRKLKETKEAAEYAVCADYTSKVMREFESEYTKMDYYLKYIEYFDSASGCNWFEKRLMNDNWSYNEGDFAESVSEFQKDLKNALKRTADDIEDGVMEHIEYALNCCEREIKNILQSKMKELGDFRNIHNYDNNDEFAEFFRDSARRLVGLRGDYFETHDKQS